MSAEHSSNQRITVVAADDDPAIRQLLSAILKKAGYDATLAANGFEAVSLVHKIQPDLVILDYMMPDMDGDRVAAVLRASSATREVPIILLSGLSAPPAGEDGDEKKLWDVHVEKPFAPSTLREAISDLLASAAAAKPVAAPPAPPEPSREPRAEPEPEPRKKRPRRAKHSQSKAEALEEFMRPRRIAFAKSLHERVDELKATLQLARREATRTDAFDTMRTAFHQIHGSAGTFGFASIGSVAGEAEDLVVEWLERADEARDGGVELEMLRTAIGDIERLLEAAKPEPSAEQDNPGSASEAPARERASAEADAPAATADGSAGPEKDNEEGGEATDEAAVGTKKSKPSLEEFMKPKRRQYAASLGQRLGVLETALALALDEGSRDLALETLRTGLHQIHGAAGMFGFGSIGKVAGQAEKRIVEWIEHADEPRDVEDELDQIRTSLGNMESLLELSGVQPPDEDAGSEADEEEAVVSDAAVEVRSERRGSARPQREPPPVSAEPAREPEEEEAEAEEAPSIADLPESPRLMLVCDDPELAASLARAARRRRYTLECFQAPAAAFERLQERSFEVLTVASSAACGSRSEWISMVRESFKTMPILLAGGDGTTAQRLEAIHAGADRYLPAPVEVLPIMEEWRELIDSTSVRSFRVLVVDDDPNIIEFEEALLTAAGCEAVCLPDARDLFATLETHDPDLLLIDVDLPGADGLEIARAVRASAAWEALPIIVQTGHVESEWRVRAFESGADDFIAKPIVDAELRARVIGRLERDRATRQLLENDPSTGFFNREHFVETVEKAMPATGGGAIATVEIAQLSPFIQQYGLEAGDIAIGAIADALREALRNTKSIVGRISGEMLAVVSPRATEGELAVLIERCFAILESDSRLSPNGTLSEGILLEASVTEFDADDAISDALDDALRARRAQRRGRVSRASAIPSQLPTTIFVVEDDENLSEMLSYALANAGFEVRCYINGHDALAALATVETHGMRPVVLMDVDLPGLDGFSILDELELARPGAFRVIMMTARGSERDQLRGLRSSAVDYVVKPLKIQVLLTKINQLVRPVVKQ